MSMLGDTHGVIYSGPDCVSVKKGGLYYLLLRHACYLFAHFRGKIFQGFPKRFRIPLSVHR